MIDYRFNIQVPPSMLFMGCALGLAACYFCYSTVIKPTFQYLNNKFAHVIDSLDDSIDNAGPEAVARFLGIWASFMIGIHFIAAFSMVAASSFATAFLSTQLTTLFNNHFRTGEHNAEEYIRANGMTTRVIEREVPRSGFFNRMLWKKKTVHQRVIDMPLEERDFRLGVRAMVKQQEQVKAEETKQDTSDDDSSYTPRGYKHEVHSHTFVPASERIRRNVEENRKQREIIGTEFDSDESHEDLSSPQKTVKEEKGSKTKKTGWLNRIKLKFKRNR